MGGPQSEDRGEKVLSHSVKEHLYLVETVTGVGSGAPSRTVRSLHDQCGSVGWVLSRKAKVAS